MSAISSYIESKKVGFADVQFMAVSESGKWPDWTRKANVQTRSIPGSNRSITQMVGFGPRTVTYPLVLATSEDYMSLQDLQGTQGTLMIFEETASVEREAVEYYGDVYDEITDVILVDISSSVRSVGGYIVCDATFIREGS